MRDLLRDYDPWILLTTCLLLFFGLLMVSSASMVISDRQYGYPFHYLIRQAVYIVMGMIAGGYVFRVPVRLWEKWGGYCMLMGLLLLLVVLIPGIGRVVNGSRRWLHVGFFSIQVTEMIKLFLLIYLAHYLVRFNERLQREWGGALKPMILLGLLAVLLVCEPDFGTFVVITMTFLGLLFIAGVRLSPFVVLLGIASTVLLLLAFFSPYRLARLTTFIDPWAQQYGAGYQLTQSLIAFGRGGFFGVGLGNSIQKLFYLPEAYTDFIFAVVAEELGLLGEVFVLTLYSILMTRIFYVGYCASVQGERYAAYLAWGIGLWLSVQALINMGVSVGMLPTKGLTLPFVSYGGSSIIVNCVAIGLILRIASEISQGGRSGRKRPLSRVKDRVVA